MSSFLRKRALQLTSMPALHRRIVPNCKPMADGGMRKCSAGACPPLGLGWGSAESTVPIRCTKPQLPLFIPWCAGASRHERFVRKCAYAAFERAVEPLHSAISSFRPPIRHSREEPAPYPDTGRENGPHPEGRCGLWQYENSKEGIRALVKRLGRERVALAVYEPTGGYERQLEGELREGGIRAYRAHPNKVRAFARASG